MWLEATHTSGLVGGKDISLTRDLQSGKNLKAEGRGVGRGSESEGEAQCWCLRKRDSRQGEARRGRDENHDEESGPYSKKQPASEQRWSLTLTCMTFKANKNFPQL